MDDLSKHTIRFDNLESTILYRLRTSDEGVIKQICDDREYELRNLPCWGRISEHYARILAEGKIPLIIDGGANIGVASVWFSLMFPKALIIAVEPAQANLKILQQNAPSGRSLVVPGALSASEGHVTLFSPRQQHWGYRTTPTNAQDPLGIPCTTVQQLLDKARVEHNASPFIVKLDIEGGEADLFSSNTGWIDETPVIIVELHDWLIPGSGDAYRAAASGRRRDQYQLGENTVSVKSDRTELVTAIKQMDRLKQITGPGPIFLFTMHRGGGTLLQRVVNTQSQVVIWGEHGGFINKLAETDALLSSFWNVCSPIDTRRLPDFLAARASEDFDPWTNPVERAAYRKFAAEFIRASFTAGLEANQRWGFKEIRYNSIRTARFLTELFPWSRIVVLRRNLAAVVVSCVTAPWSLKFLLEVRPHQVRKVVEDVAYAIAAVSVGHDRILGELPARAMSVSTETLANEVQNMFDFLLLPQRDVSDVLVRRIGSTNEAASLCGMNRLKLTKIAEESLAAVSGQISREGVNTQRIVRSKFGFLAGDHGLAGSGLSSMF